jgi:hypothetical protein
MGKKRQIEQNAPSARLQAMQHPAAHSLFSPKVGQNSNLARCEKIKTREDNRELF